MKLILTERKAEAPDVETFRFKPQEPLTWKAGQFIHYVLHHEPTDERGSDRWFTVSSAPFENAVTLTTRFSEKSSTFKKALRELKNGDAIEIADIDGDFTVDDTEKNYICIAGGIGITPFYAILKQLRHEGKNIDVTLLYANRDEDIVFKKELEDIARENPRMRLHYVISPERIDAKKIAELVPDLQKPYFYISGPEPMVKAMAEMVKDMGVPAEHIKLDDFPGYPVEP